MHGPGGPTVSIRRDNEERECEGGAEGVRMSFSVKFSNSPKELTSEQLRRPRAPACLTLCSGLQGAMNRIGTVLPYSLLDRATQRNCGSVPRDESCFKGDTNLSLRQ